MEELNSSAELKVLLQYGNRSRSHYHFPGLFIRNSFNHRNISNNIHSDIQDECLLFERDVDFYLQTSAIPWRWHVGRLVVATADEAPENLERLKARYGNGVRFQPIKRRRLLQILEARFTGTIAQRAAFELEQRFPEFSARRQVTPAQMGIGLAVVLGVIMALRAAPAAACLALSLLWGAAFLANILFRAALVWIGAGSCEAPPVASVRDEDLPLYSLIVPLYREATVLPGLVTALSALDYPVGRVEVLLALEADDSETVAAAERAAGDPRFVVLHVPPGQPRTKPKAANYALAFARGEFTVIYDAEDRPEPDQLRKAVAQFRTRSASVACLQARLNFYNADENWLTRGLMAQTPLTH